MKKNFKENKKIIGGLISFGIIFLLVATVVAYPDDNDDSKENFVVEHTVPKDDPFISIGCDFLMIIGDSYDPYLFILFDNTVIYIDTNNDQIFDRQVTRNGGDYYTITDWTYGARIHTSKPVAYRQKIEATHWPVYCYIPSIDNLKNEYFIYKDSHQLIVPETTTIYIDEENDGTIETEITVLPLTRKSFSLTNSWARVYSDKPFYLFRFGNNIGASVVGPSGFDYYIPHNGYIKYLIIPETGTKVQVDNNNDGNYDETIQEGKGLHGPYDYASGAHLNSNKPITIFYSLTGENQRVTYLIPSNMMGSDMWGDISDRRYITGLYSNTSFFVDKASENDLNPNFQSKIGANQLSTPFPNYDTNCHTWGTKPFYIDFIDGQTSISSQAYSYILSTTSHEPNELGLNETVKMNVRVFNPFATTEINNVSVTVKIDDNFKLSGGNTVEVTIKKLHLDTDIEKDTEMITITPTHENDLYTFTLSKDNSTLFESLNFFEYYDIDYEIITPTKAKNYAFQPIEVSYDASTWDLPTYND